MSDPGPIILSVWLGLFVAAAIYYVGYIHGKYAEAHNIAIRLRSPTAGPDDGQSGG